MNLNDLMKQLNLGDMQQQMQQMQEQMKHITATGSSGGGMVTIEMSGDMEITNLTIDPAALEEQDVAMLQDLVRAAINSLLSNWKDQIKQQTMGGMPFPGSFGQ